MDINVYTDGSCSWRTREGGIGILIKYSDAKNNQFNLKYYKGFSNTTIGRMELLGILYGMKLLTTTDLKVRIYCDSKYAVNTAKMLEEQHKNDLLFKNGKVKNKDIIALILQERKRFSRIQFHWVKGHSDTKGNNQADELAGMGFRDTGENKIVEICDSNQEEYQTDLCNIKLLSLC